MDDILIYRDTIVHGPDGQGYRITRNVRRGEPVCTTDFEALNGAPQPKPNEPMPDWLARFVNFPPGSKHRA
jgi:hypothetical protein